MSEHTPTPWAYRPARHDDWGWIRGPKDDEKGIAPLVATARSGNWEPEAMLDQHRAAGTDPYGANAAFIVKAVNNHDFLVEALKHAKARFECLAEDFKGEENNVNWAMCSVDAERMTRALDAVGAPQQRGADVDK